jgi:hypothetical protein
MLRRDPVLDRDGESRLAATDDRARQGADGAGTSNVVLGYKRKCGGYGFKFTNSDAELGPDLGRIRTRKTRLRRSCLLTSLQILAGAQLAQRTVRPTVIVVPPPVFNLLLRVCTKSQFSAGRTAAESRLPRHTKLAAVAA